jgi:hypothetical protein
MVFSYPLLLWATASSALRLFAGSPAREAFLRPAATVEREIGGVLFARSTRAVVLTYASLDFLIRIGYVISIGPYGLFQQGGTCGG